MAHPGRLLSRVKRALRILRASRRRRQLAGVTFVGITGTSGKTTTTSLTAAILGAAGPCQQTQAYNSLGDVARALNRTGPGHRYCVAELAAAGTGTMDDRVRLFQPDIAVLTVIGREHISSYEGIEAIAAEKAKVVLGPPADGVAVLNIDDPLVRAIGERATRRILWFGSDPAADLRLIEARSRWPEPLALTVEYAGERYQIPTLLHGRHLAVPVLAALGVAIVAGLSPATALPVIAQFQPLEGRMQAVTAADGITWIRDDCKAPAWSFAAPFDFLRDAQAPRKVAIIGTIGDTRGDSGRNYRNFARTARAAADLVVLVGPNGHRGLRARSSPEDSSIQAFPTTREAGTFLREELRAGDLVLLKASHKADHLMRLILDRDAPVSCWTEDCREIAFCAQCPRLRT